MGTESSLAFTTKGRAYLETRQSLTASANRKRGFDDLPERLCFGWTAVSSWGSGYAFDGRRSGDERRAARTPPQKSGTVWQVIASPNDPPDSADLYDDQLNSVNGSSASDVWAVGRVCCTPHGTQEYYSSLLEHWDGASWTIIPGAPTEPADVQLFAVAAIAPNDAWAFGHGGSPNTEPLIEHWNGSAWSVVPAPTIYGKGELVAVTSISSNNIWAAGDANFQPLVERWNGTQWSVMPNVTEKGGAAYFSGIAASSANDIMAVGGYSHPDAHILAAHWNGSSWSDVTPAKDFFDSQFLAVTSDAAGSFSASGYENPNKRTAVPQTLVEHWNGLKFVRVPTPTTSRRDRPSRTGSRASQRNRPPIFGPSDCGRIIPEMGRRAACSSIGTGKSGRSSRDHPLSKRATTTQRITC